MFKRLMVVISIINCSSIVVAQTDSVFVDIGPCLAQEIEAERLACYARLDEQVRATKSRIADLPVVSVPRGSRVNEQEPAILEQSVSDSAASTAAETFGLESSSADKARKTTARVLNTENDEQELVDTIAGLQQRMPNKWTVTLASGQVWQQVNSSLYKLREGQEIRIYPSPFGGSYRMSAEGINGFIQVTRVN